MSKHCDIEFRRLFVKGTSKHKAGQHNEILISSSFSGGGGIGLWQTYLYVILSTAK